MLCEITRGKRKKDSDGGSRVDRDGFSLKGLVHCSSGHFGAEDVSPLLHPSRLRGAVACTAAVGRRRVGIGRRDHMAQRRPATWPACGKGVRVGGSRAAGPDAGRTSVLAPMSLLLGGPSCRPGEGALQSAPRPASQQAAQHLGLGASRAQFICALPLAFYRLRRHRAATHSQLDCIPGIGPKRRQGVLRTLGSLATVRAAKPATLVSGHPRRRAAAAAAIGRCRGP